MEDRQQLYTVGIWTAKEGKEDEFAREWTEFARWTSEHQPGAADAYLLQDAAHPQRFISFGPWESAERIDAWRATPEFKAFGARARELCDEFQPGTYIAAAHV
jgi:heme-degrading monooxygenase HmoA